MKINPALFLLIFLGLINVAKADIAPAPDEMRVTSDLTINTDQDLSDYRFFLNFLAAVREVEVKSNGQTVIPSQGGGALYSSGTLLAVPKKNLTDFPDKLQTSNDEKHKSLANAIGEGKIPGIIELGKHSFYRTIKKSERANWTYPVYRIEKEGASLKMVKEADLAPKMSLEEQKLVESGWFYRPVIIAGVLIAFGVLLTGVFLFRKVLKKS